MNATSSSAESRIAEVNEYDAREIERLFSGHGPHRCSCLVSWWMSLRFSMQNE
jgi:hypothetical protein